MAITLSGYELKYHTIGQMVKRHIHPELIDRFVLSSNEKSHIKKFKRSNGSTRLVLNKTKIKNMLDNIETLMPKNAKDMNSPYVQRLIENKKVLEELWEEGGITAVVNEDQKVVITVF